MYFILFMQKLSISPESETINSNTSSVAIKPIVNELLIEPFHKLSAN